MHYFNNALRNLQLHHNIGVLEQIYNFFIENQLESFPGEFGLEDVFQVLRYN